MNKLHFFLKKNVNNYFTFFVFSLHILITKCGFSQNIQTYELLLSEIMSDPKPAVYLPEDEFIEVYNNSKQIIDLSDVIIRIGNKLLTPKSFQLFPDSFFVFWDKDIPALKNSGDSIQILFDDKIIHSVFYNPLMHTSKFKRNGGWSIELTDFSKPCLTENNWKSSVDISGGSPGYSNSIKEKLIDYPVQLKSYYPKNDTQLTLVFNVPIETLETEYQTKILLNEALINIPKIDSNSIESILIKNVTTCYDSDFEELNLKYGLPKKPKYKDIIINELLFNPEEGGSDFIEVYNASKASIDLSQLYFCLKNDNNELEEPFHLCLSNSLLLPFEYSVFCFDKDWLSETFVEVVNIVESKIPAMNNDYGNIVLSNKSGEIIDEVHYNENWHFKELTDNENISLEKINPFYLNTESNWTSASFFNNYATPGYENSNFIKAALKTNKFEIKNKIVTPNSDGKNDQLIIRYNLSDPGWTTKINVINYSGITLHTIHENGLLGTKGSIHWNGKLKNKSVIKPGIYALKIIAFNSVTQEKIQEKLIFYINGNLQ